MTYISPIFVPMALFHRTKGYFDGWVKVCVSCALQPAVVAGFIALLVTMYDSAIYKNCEFLRHDYTDNTTKFSTFELRVPDNDPDKCKESLGYKLLQYYAGEGWEEHLLILFPIKSIVTDTISIFPELVCILIFSILFYYFSKSIGRFASDITSGPNMDAVTASPTKIVDLVKKAVSFAVDAAQGKPPPPPKGPGEGAGRKGGEQGGGEAGDSVSSKGGDGASDLVSSGGGK
jgi:type IV secretion system protein VirB6